MEQHLRLVPLHDLRSRADCYITACRVCREQLLTSLLKHLRCRLPLHIFVACTHGCAITQDVLLNRPAGHALHQTKCNVALHASFRCTNRCAVSDRVWLDAIPPQFLQESEGHLPLGALLSCINQHITNNCVSLDRSLQNVLDESGLPRGTFS